MNSDKYNEITDHEVNLLAAKLIANVYSSHAEALADMKINSSRFVDLLDKTYFVEWPETHQNSESGFVCLMLYRGVVQNVWNPCKNLNDAFDLVQVTKERMIEPSWNIALANRDIKKEQKKRTYIDVILAGPREWTICAIIANEEYSKIQNAEVNSAEA